MVLPSAPMSRPESSCQARARHPISRLHPRRAVLFAAAFASVLSGCKNEPAAGNKEAPIASAAPSATAPALASTPSAPAPAPSAGAAPGAPAEAAGAAAPPQVTITVQDEGQGAKKLLRYSFKKGQTKSFTMKMNLTMSATMDGQPGQPMPPVEFDFGGKSLTVDVAADGTATRQTTFTTFAPKMPNLPPQVAAQMEAEMKGLEGVQITERITARGQVTGVEVNQATVKSPQVQQLLSNLIEGMSNSFLPLPETPVGLGAKWESRSVMFASGVGVTQIGRFKVAAIQGDKLTLDLGIEQLADAKAVPSFDSGPGVQTQLVSMDGKGSGQTVVNLGTLDSNGSVQIETKTVTRVSSAPQPAAPQVPGMPAAPAIPAQSALSTLVAKVAVTIKMTD